MYTFIKHNQLRKLLFKQENVNVFQTSRCL